MTEALDPVSGWIDLDRAVAVRPAELHRGAELADAYVHFMQEFAAIGVAADGQWRARPYLPTAYPRTSALLASA